MVMIMKRSQFLTLALVAAWIFGAGCEQKPATSQVSAGGSEKPSGASHVIAVVPKLTEPVFWRSVRAGAEEAGKELGYEIVWEGPDRETNSARQIQIIDEAIGRHVAGVVLSPVDRLALVPTVEKLAQLKIPCAIIDSGVESVQFVCFAATANYDGGVLAARRMGQILGGKGNVLVVRHLPGSHATVKRVSGFTDTMANEFPGIKIVGSESGEDRAEIARKVTEQMLQQHPDVQGLFACNVDVSVGALQALQEAKRTDVKMVAFDPAKSLLEGLRAGQVDSIILQNPHKMGYEGVKAVALKLKGQDVPRMVDTGVEIVTDASLTDPKIMRLLGLQQ
jgi:ribose transport system substrate-binding protein